MRLSICHVWNAAGCVIVLTFVLALLIGMPYPIQGVYRHGWAGKGFIASWFAQKTNKGWFCEVWTEPKRTGFPIDASVTIKTY